MENSSDINQNGEEIKKKKSINPLVILAVLVFLLVVVGTIIIFTRKDARNVYFYLLDKSLEEGNELIDEYYDNLQNNYLQTGNISFAIKGNDFFEEDDKELMKIINELAIDYRVENSNKNKLSNIDLDFKYKSADLLDLNMLLRNENIYLNMGQLFDNNIKISDELTWTNDYREKTKIILKEFNEALKINLKKEYFRVGSDELLVEGKDILTDKYILELKEEDIYNLVRGITDTLMNRKEFISALKDITGYTEKELIDLLKEFRNNFDVAKESNFLVEINLNKKDNELIKITIGNIDEKISFIKSGENSYDIAHTYYNISDVVGDMKINDDEIEIKYDDNNYVLELAMNDDTVKLNINTNGIIYNMDMKKDNGETKYVHDLLIDYEGMELKVLINGAEKEIDKLTEYDVSNSVSIDELTEEDYLEITDNLYNNTTLMNLVNDIYYIYSNYVYSDEYYYDEEYYEDEYYNNDYSVESI